MSEVKDANPEFVCQTFNISQVCLYRLSCVVLPIKYLLLNMAKLKEKLGGERMVFIFFNTAVDL